MKQSKYAAGVVEERKKNKMEMHEDKEGQQKEGLLEQTGTTTKTIPIWSEVLGGKGEALVLLRQAHPRYARLAVPKVPLVKSPLAKPPRTTHDARVGALSRMMEEWFEEAQGEAELDVFEDLLKELPVERQHWGQHSQSGGVGRKRHWAKEVGTEYRRARRR